MAYRYDPVTGGPVNVDAYRTERGGFVVVRVWETTTERGTYADREAFHAVSLSDTSSPWDCSGSGTGYDPACGWCWLGAAHTADAHTAKLQGRSA